jgi:hypothetical protein
VLLSVEEVGSCSPVLLEKILALPGAWVLSTLESAWRLVADSVDLFIPIVHQELTQLATGVLTYSLVIWN